MALGINIGDRVVYEPLDGYEYGIMQHGVAGVHRWGMTAQEAGEWVASWEEDGGRAGAFYVVRRPVGTWEEA